VENGCTDAVSNSVPTIEVATVLPDDQTYTFWHELLVLCTASSKKINNPFLYIVTMSRSG